MSASMMMMTSVRRELQCGEEWGGSSRENGMWRVGDQHADEVEGGWPGNLVLLLHQVGGSPAQLHFGWWISGCEVCQSTHPLAPGPVARG